MNSVVDMTSFSTLKYLTPQNAQFILSSGGFLSLMLDGERYARISLHRALPFTKPNEYISVLNTESKELGIIRNLDEFDGEQASIIQRELSLRYYSPNILKILSVKEKMGYVYFEVISTAGNKCFAVKDIGKSIRRMEKGRIIIFDVDGNRYYIEDILAIDKASIKRINCYLI